MGFLYNEVISAKASKSPATWRFVQQLIQVDNYTKLFAICEVNSLVTHGFSHKGSVMCNAFHIMIIKVTS